nr:motilin receptor [Vulpes vulpes]
MGGPGNSSDGAEGAQLPCDERLCSPFPLGALVPVTAVCLGLFAAGVSGNLVTVLLVGRERAPRSPTSLYLGSMAVSDLLILLGLPLDLYRLWRSRPWVFGQLLCRLSLYLGEGCTYATLLHVAALSVERYLAVCRPLRARALLSRRRARALIAALWAVALLSAAPFLFLVGVEQDAGGPDRAALKPEWPCPGLGLLGCGLAESKFCGRRLLSRVVSDGLGPRAGSRELTLVPPCFAVAVVLAFLVCWLPFHVGRIIYINTEDSRMMHFSQYFNIVALQLFYLSASINPILYSLISKKYRAAARKLLLPRRPTRRRVCRSGAVEGGPGRATAGLAETGPHGHTAAAPSAARQVASRLDPGTSGRTGV